MATIKDPRRCFAAIEVIERLLELRADLGFSQTLYLNHTNELMYSLDSYGFDIYTFSTSNEKLNYGDYRSPIVPGGDSMHASMTAH